MKKFILAVFVCAVGVAGCGGSNADKVSDNLSKEAEKFKAQRKIIAINGITDKVILDVEGKCSVEGEALGTLNALVLICKHSPKDYRKHWIGISDNVTFTVTQIDGLAVSEYRTKFIIRPESIIPDLDLVTGQ